MKDNRGFTIIEVLATIIIISLISTIVSRFIGSTLTISQNEAYEIMKNNIISASEDYLKECGNGILECNITWTNNKTSFSAIELKNSGYFKSLESPIDGKDLSNCLNIKAEKENVTIKVNLIDNCY